MTPVRPCLLPGEFAAGYLGRVVSINGWRNADEAISALTTWANTIDRSQTDAPAIAVLARVAGCDTATFVARHTLLPLTLRLGLDAHDVASETVDRRAALELALSGGGHENLFLCASCCAEHLHVYGTPFWRREHQIPGASWCQIHGLPLIDSIDRKAYLTSPGWFNTYTPATRDHILESQKACDAIQRYVDICTRLLSHSVSLDAQEVSRLARARALELGLRTEPNERNGEPLSDFLQRQYRNCWPHDPRNNPFGHGCRFRKTLVDAIVYGRSCNLPVTAYVAAFAAMYPSADSAFDALVAVGKSDEAGHVPNQAAA